MEILERGVVWFYVVDLKLYELCMGEILVNRFGHDRGMRAGERPARIRLIDVF